MQSSQKEAALTLIRKTKKEKVRYLEWFDILSLTVILFGWAILSSTMSLLGLSQGTATVEGNISFSVADNYNAIAVQSGLLAIALLYLRARNFDFKAWRIKLDLRAVLCAAFVFLIGSLAFDAYMVVAGSIREAIQFPNPIGSFFWSEPVSRVLHAALNGAYEELYFLGICLAVRPRHLKWAVPFSLLVRASFHTYQGLMPASGIGLVFGGAVYLIYRRSKDKNLAPFFIAHSAADVFGLGILSHFIG